MSEPTKIRVRVETVEQPPIMIRVTSEIREIRFAPVRLSTQADGESNDR